MKKNIEQLPKNLDIIVLRYTLHGELSNSKPCKTCLQYIKTFNIRKVYYSDEEGNIKCEKAIEVKDCIESILTQKYKDYLLKNDKSILFTYVKRRSKYK